MSVLGTNTNPRDRAPFVVDIRLVTGGSTGSVAFTQKLPDRPFHPPREQLPLRPGEPAEFELQFSGQEVVAAMFDVALQGAPGERFAVHFLFAHRGAQSGDREEPIDDARFELTRVFLTAGYHQTLELTYDGTTARWRTLSPSLPLRWVKRPAPPDSAVAARGGASSHPGWELAAKPTRRRESRREVEPIREPPLHEAAAAADAAAVRSLLERGADVHERNDWSETPLHVAVRSPVFVWMHTPRQLDVVEQLLDAGADPNARDLLGATPLHKALEDLHRDGSANLDVVKLLLLRGAHPDARSDGGLRPADKPPLAWTHISPGDIRGELARRSALLGHVNEMLDAARRGTLA